MSPQKDSTTPLSQNMPYSLQGNFFLNSLAIPSSGKNVGHEAEVSLIWKIPQKPEFPHAQLPCNENWVFKAFHSRQSPNGIQENALDIRH